MESQIIQCRAGSPMLFAESERSYNKWFNLLKKGEKDLPESVKDIIDFCVSNNLWFMLSRNKSAKSCKDAANKRKRLGHTGIPLEHELKSYLGKFSNSDGSDQFIALHYRGNQEVDSDKVNRLLNVKSGIKRLEKRELLKLFKSDYGLVTPFKLGNNAFLNTPVFHIFDKSILENNLSPYTMMTNAGSYEWAIEFKSNQIIHAFTNSKVADIILDNWKVERKKSKSPKIGIITGNAPDSGILLWQKINKKIRKRKGKTFYGDISFPHVVVESIPDMGLSMELDERETETWEALKSGIVSLCNQDVEILCIACNTTQYFEPEINKITSINGARFISIADITQQHLENEKIYDFAFLGVKYVTEIEKKWSAFKALKKFKVETLSDESIKRIHELAFKVKKSGINVEGINKLRDLLNSSTTSENIVIALTEISILLDNQKEKSKKGRNYIDTLDLLAEAVVDEYLSLINNTIN